jgi:membrane-associated phospholipid phosphatase
MRNVETLDRVLSPKTMLPLALATAFFMRHRRGSGRLALGATLAVVSEEGLKRIVSRRRPRGMPFGRRRSFPSGHSSGSASYFLGLALTARKGPARLASVLAAGGAVAAINVFRVREHEHWPSDVVVGDAIGALAIGVAHLALVALRRRLSAGKNRIAQQRHLGHWLASSLGPAADGASGSASP